MDTHKDKVAIVTGGRHGIGRGIAALLAERGAQVVIANRQDGEAAAQAIGHGAIALRGDVANEADWARVAAQIDDLYGRADILVNAAGIYYATQLAEMDFAAWRAMLAVNLDGAFLGIRAIAPLMKRNGWGRIVNIGSDGIGMVMEGMSHYLTAKMGLVGLTRGLASELAPDGITINTVHPGLTDTEGAAIMPEAVKATIYNQQAIKRLGKPADIAGPVAFLTSDDGAFVTGQSLVADGGLLRL